MRASILVEDLSIANTKVLVLTKNLQKAEAEILELKKLESKIVKRIRVVFDSPPDPESNCGFVEVETLDGKSLQVGEWVDTKDGYWVLELDVVLP